MCSDKKGIKLKSDESQQIRQGSNGLKEGVLRKVKKTQCFGDEYPLKQKKPALRPTFHLTRILLT
jgi:hypothetical protein